MTPATADALVRVYRLLDEVGERPPNAVVFAALRGVGHRFRTSEAKAVLSGVRKDLGPSRVPKTSAPGPVGKDPGLSTRAPADHKGMSKPVSDVLPGLISEPTAQTVKPKKTDPRTGNERLADAAIELLRPRIEPMLSGMTWSTWRSRNRRAVVDMIAAGLTPEQIDHEHDMIRDAAGNPFVTMAWFQNRLNSRRVQSGSAPSDEFTRSPHATGAVPQWGEPVNRPLR